MSILRVKNFFWLLGIFAHNKEGKKGQQDFVCLIRPTNIHEGIY